MAIVRKKVSTGPKSIYVTKELSDLVGKIDHDEKTGKSMEFTARIVSLCRKGKEVENAAC